MNRRFIKENVLAIILTISMASAGALISSCETKEGLAEVKMNIQCDLSNVTYTQTIKPIIVTKCAIAPCHGGGSSKAGVSYEGNDEETYAKIKTSALTGQMMTALNSSMRGYAGDPCNIPKIDAWIKARAPNN